MPSSRGEPRPRQRAEERLRGLVAGLPAGASLPAQRRLAKLLGQPRPTVARALAELVEDGVLVPSGRHLAVADEPELPVVLDRSLVLLPPAGAHPDDRIVRRALACIRARGWQVIAIPHLVTSGRASR